MSIRGENGGRSKALHESLEASDAFEALALGGADEALWADCDLASLAENRLGDSTSPRELDAARRADWIARATSEGKAYPLAERADYEQLYWLRESGDRVGTVGVSTSTLGSASVRVSSLYVLPEHRSAGTGGRALGRLRDACFAQGLGFRLSTSWAWQRAVRFYLRAGLWVRMWKRDLEFCAHPRDPTPRIEITDDRATLGVDAPSGERVMLEEATRHGDALAWSLREKFEREGVHGSIGEAAYHASSTLALALALRGWPLVRSPQHWADTHWADAGPPEALAYKIVLWEAWDRKHGWRVDAPRIPGLEYATWAELEARWASADG